MISPEHPATDRRRPRPPADPFLVALGRVLADARREAGLSQAALGRAIGTDHSIISRWERAERTLPIAALYRISLIIGQPTGELLDDAEGRLPRDSGVVRAPVWVREEHADAAAD